MEKQTPLSGVRYMDYRANRALSRSSRHIRNDPGQLRDFGFVALYQPLGVDLLLRRQYPYPAYRAKSDDASYCGALLWKYVSDFIGKSDNAHCTAPMIHLTPQSTQRRGVDMRPTQ